METRSVCASRRDLCSEAIGIILLRGEHICKAIMKFNPQVTEEASKEFKSTISKEGKFPHLHGLVDRALEGLKQGFSRHNIPGIGREPKDRDVNVVRVLDFPSNRDLDASDMRFANALEIEGELSIEQMAAKILGRSKYLGAVDGKVAKFATSDPDKQIMVFTSAEGCNFILNEQGHAVSETGPVALSDMKTVAKDFLEEHGILAPDLTSKWKTSVKNVIRLFEGEPCEYLPESGEIGIQGEEGLIPLGILIQQIRQSDRLLDPVKRGTLKRGEKLLPPTLQAASQSLLGASPLRESRWRSDTAAAAFCHINPERYEMVHRGEYYLNDKIARVSYDVMELEETLKKHPIRIRGEEVELQGIEPKQRNTPGAFER